MRLAYAALGLAFLIVFGGAYLLIDRTQAPVYDESIDSHYEPNDSPMLSLASPAFTDGGAIPARYTCEGENVSPELQISGVPSGTQSLALLVADPDIPESVRQNMGIDEFDHWVLFNIPPDTHTIPEGERPPGVVGMNSAGQGYTGPCPPDGAHRYIFTLYALDGELPLTSAAHRDDVMTAMKGRILEKATLTGVYEKHNQ